MSASAPPPANPAEYKQAQTGLGTTALVMGTLQFFGIGTIGSILAIVFGYLGLKKAEQGHASNGGVAKSGFILGIIGAGMSIVILVFGLVMIVAGAASPK